MIKIKKVKLNEIKPYWRNPRINDQAIEIVKESIKKYGYNQPIVVDKDNVIVVGHTRYYALKELGFDEVEVFETDLDKKKCQEYRIADNKTHEYSFWNYEELKNELKTLENLEDISVFFKNDIQLIEEIKNIKIDVDNSSGGIEDLTKSIDEGKKMIEVKCPNCGEVFFVDLDELQRKYNLGLVNLNKV